MDNTCAICCDELEQKTIKTPCGHQMHNNCLTHWLLLNETCPICRFKIGNNDYSNDESYDEENYDDEEEPIDHIEFNFMNNCYVPNYNTILETLKEIVYRIYTNEEEFEDIDFVYDWIFDSQNNRYIIKLNTRNNIVNIEVGGEILNNTLYLDILFKNINKSNSKYLNKIFNKYLYVSKYNPSKLPQKIKCF